MPEPRTISTTVAGRMSGWGHLMQITDPQKFQRLLHRNFAVAIKTACLDVVAFLHEMIRTKQEYAPNAPLTVARKRSSRPLVDHGDLIRAIAFKVHSPFHAEVGVKRITRGGVNVAAVLHDGFTIDLSNPKYKKMRVYLAIMRRELVRAGRLAEDAYSKNGRPGFLVVPGRPFFDRPFRSRITQIIVYDAAQAAIDATIRGEELRASHGNRYSRSRRQKLRQLMAEGRT